jgi:hypothetical protein
MSKDLVILAQFLAQTGRSAASAHYEISYGFHLPVANNRHVVQLPPITNPYVSERPEASS